MPKTKINHYCWQGLNAQGRKLTGIIEAPSLAFVKKELGNRAILVKKIRRKSNLWFSSRITAATLSLFFRQLATLLNAGVPLIQSFDIVANSQKNPLMKALIEAVKKDVEQGLSFSEALKKRPLWFNDLVCNLIAAGEKSGKLDLMLAKVASYKEQIESLKRKIKKALAYPLVVISIASLVTVALLAFVVPQFEALFQSFGAELPLLTRAIIDLAALVNNYWHFSLVCFSLFILGFQFARRSLPGFSYGCDKLVLKIPIFGSLLLKAMIARFARTLALCFASGLPLPEALAAVAELMVSKVYAQAIEQIKKELFTGEPLHRAMASSDLFPLRVVQLVAIGEESGTLELMLSKLADNYEEEVNTGLDISINLLEPLIMALLGLIIGSLVIAMYLPIFKLGSVV